MLDNLIQCEIGQSEPKRLGETSFYLVENIVKLGTVLLDSMLNELTQ